MAFLGKRKAVFLAYPKDGDDTGIALPIITDEDNQLVADFFASPDNKTAELAIYPDQIEGKLTLSFAFDSNQDFIALYVRVRLLSDKDESKRPIYETSIMYDPEEDEAETICISIPNEPIVIFIMITEQLNMAHGKNRLTLTKI